MRTCLAVLIALCSYPSFAETISCTKDFTMSSTVGIKKENNGSDHYLYVPGSLQEVFDGRTLWNYSIVSENDDLIVGALRQKKYPSDTQVVVLDRRNKTLMKTVVQGTLRLTMFGPCTFAR